MALLEAARCCFTEPGYEATTAAAILARAGMARGAHYHYFPSGKGSAIRGGLQIVDNAFHREAERLGAISSPMPRVRSSAGIFLNLCTRDDYARIVFQDGPEVLPGTSVLTTGRPSRSCSLLHAQIVETLAVGEVTGFDPDSMASALYGAVRRAGEFVVSAQNRQQAAARATATINVLLDGVMDVKARYHPAG